MNREFVFQQGYQNSLGDGKYTLWKDSFASIDNFYPLLKLIGKDVFADASSVPVIIKSYAREIKSRLYNLSYYRNGYGYKKASVTKTRSMIPKNTSIYIGCDSIIGLYKINHNIISVITSLNIGGNGLRPSKIVNLYPERYDVFLLPTIHYSKFDNLTFIDDTLYKSGSKSITYNINDITLFVSKEKVIDNEKFLKNNYSLALRKAIFSYIEFFKANGAKIEIVSDAYINQFIKHRDNVEFTSIIDALKAEKEILASVQNQFQEVIDKRLSPLEVLKPYLIC